MSGGKGIPSFAAPDVYEHGAPRQGEPQQLGRRLYVQLLVYSGVVDAGELLEAVEATTLRLVLYASLTDPQGIGVLAIAEDPADFATTLRELMLDVPFVELTPVPEMTMIGRTYGSGRERDLEDWLLHQVPKRVADPRYPWAIWYPLRRKPSFYQLDIKESAPILGEHGMLGRSYGEAGLAQDIRLKCFGLDRQDNEFLIGLVGPELFPLSKLVEDMRQTKQTAEWLDSLGPFFVGRRLGAVNLGA